MTDARKQRFPRWWQALIIIASGIVLGFSSCVGFLGTLTFSGGRGNGQGLSALFMLGFFGGIAIALIGCVLLLIAVARAIVDAAREPPAKSPASLSAAIPLAPGASPFPPAGILGITASREEPALRQLQIALAVLMLLPLGSVATTFLIFLNRPKAWGSILLVLSTYVLSQVPYAFALARTRRGLDRLGIAIAFAGSCVFFVEGFLPLFRFPSMLRYGPAPGLFFWPGLFLIGHIVVAVFAWRAGQLSPPDQGDSGLIVASFAGVIIYLVVVRFFEVHFLPLLLR
jgi:hypothetical protein